MKASLNELHDRLKLVREQKGLSQKEFAERIGLTSPMAISHYEKGTSKPPVSRLREISTQFEVNLLWLLSGEGHMSGPQLVTTLAAGTRSSGTLGAGIRSTSEPATEWEMRYVEIPLYNVRASAGAGMFIDYEKIIDYLCFKRDWIQQELKCIPQELAMIRAKGRSMYPTFDDGDLLLVNRSWQQFTDDAVYVLSLPGDTILVKRLVLQTDGRVFVKSDNLEYPGEYRSFEEINIAGRVVWVGKKL